jgi:hypothetical protein
MLRFVLTSALVITTGCTLDFDMVGPKGGGADGGSGAGIASSSGGNGEGAGQIGGNNQTGGNGEGGTPISDCTINGGSCVPIPDGFDGAVVLTAAPCSSAVFDGFESFSAADAECGCNCFPSSLECGLPGLATSFSNSICDGNGASGTFVPSSVCAQVPGGNNIHSVQLNGLAVPPGCLSDGASALLPPIDWSDPIKGCAFDSVGCDGGDICAPSDSTRYCFYRAANGPLDCPAGFIDTAVIEPGDISDNRDCVCECSETSFALCAAPVWSVHGDASCSDQLNTEAGTCVTDAGGGVIFSAMVSVQANVSCEQGRVVTGGVTGEPTLQVCCSPP